MPIKCWTVWRDAGRAAAKAIPKVWIPYGPAHVARQHAWNVAHRKAVATLAASLVCVTVGVPLGVRNRTMAKNLAHKTIVDDSSKCSVASADYLLVFRRRGENPVPIAHPHGLTEYAGARKMPADLLKYRNWDGNQIENKFSHWIWRNYASAFWDDVRIERVLPFRDARDEEDEKHVHPLQLDVIDRAIVLWSNPGETVLTPFMGVGSEVYGAVEGGRRGIGIELKPTYFAQAKKNMALVGVRKPDQPALELEPTAPLAVELAGE